MHYPLSYLQLLDINLALINVHSIHVVLEMNPDIVKAFRRVKQ
jgi:hypothetical protein